MGSEGWGSTFLSGGDGGRGGGAAPVVTCQVVTGEAAEPWAGSQESRGLIRAGVHELCDFEHGLSGPRSPHPENGGVGLGDPQGSPSPGISQAFETELSPLNDGARQSHKSDRWPPCPVWFDG